MFLEGLHELGDGLVRISDDTDELWLGLQHVLKLNIFVLLVEQIRRNIRDSLNLPTQQLKYSYQRLQHLLISGQRQNFLSLFLNEHLQLDDGLRP